MLCSCSAKGFGELFRCAGSFWQRRRSQGKVRGCIGCFNASMSLQVLQEKRKRTSAIARGPRSGGPSSAELTFMRSKPFEPLTQLFEMQRPIALKCRWSAALQPPASASSLSRAGSSLGSALAINKPHGKRRAHETKNALPLVVGRTGRRSLYRTLGLTMARLLV